MNSFWFIILVFLSVCGSAPLLHSTCEQDSDVKWSVCAPPGRNLTLTVLHLELDQRFDCAIDELRVFVNQKYVKTLCGTSEERHLTEDLWIKSSPGGCLSLSLKPRNQVIEMDSRFQVFYTLNDYTCPSMVTPNSIITPLRDDYPENSIVTVRCLKGHIFPFDHHNDHNPLANIEYKSKCQRNGKWSPVKACQPVDCGLPHVTDLIKLTVTNPLTTYRSKISFMCTSPFYRYQGSNYTCNINGHWVSDTGKLLSEDSPKCLPVCGLNTEHEFGGEVFGGTPATAGQIPWQLLSRKNPRAGASLISDYWAITAAHVVNGYETKSMSWLGGMIDAKNGSPIHMLTEKIILHPNYTKVSGSEEQTNFDNDIALIKMSARVPLSENIRPLCLPDKTEKLSTYLTVSGFGKYTSPPEKTSQFLLHGFVTVYPLKTCDPRGLTVTENMLCAGGQAVDSCKGDSGGPLFSPSLGYGSAEKPYKLFGVVSWGPSECGDQSHRGYYTKVQNYLDWIRVTMENN